MKNLDEVRQLVGDPGLSDVEAQAIDEACRLWADLMCEAVVAPVPLYTGPKRDSAETMALET